MTTPKPTTIPDSTVKTTSTFDVILAAFGGLGYALSARALLLVSLVGTFALAWRAMDVQTTGSMIILALFAVGAVMPVTILEIRKGRDGR